MAKNPLIIFTLGLDDVKYCYSFSKRTYGWSLKTRNDAPSLVLALHDSRQASRPGLCSFNYLQLSLLNLLTINVQYIIIFLYASAFKVFDRPPRFVIKASQINTFAHHDSGSALVTQLDHPRVVHILLEYANTRSSFTKRGKNKDNENSEVCFLTTWIGLGLSFEEKDALLKSTISSTEYTIRMCTTKTRIRRVVPII